MQAEKFDRKSAFRGDLLVLARDQAKRLMFKGIGFDGEVIATWLDRQSGRPDDVILRQRDVLRLVG